jgi:8-oxo-dGTP pyrophosphatase MutT (NUDIX family)
MSKRRAELEVSAGGIVFRRLSDQTAEYLLIRDSYDNWGFPKGHLEDGETPAVAATRETAEETGLYDLTLRGPIRVIDWHFRFRGRHIHKYCHFFLFESAGSAPSPQLDEGITACPPAGRSPGSGGCSTPGSPMPWCSRRRRRRCPT